MKEEIWKKVLEDKSVEFVPARNATSLLSFRSKYTPLAAASGDQSSKTGRLFTTTGTKSVSMGRRGEIFPSEKVDEYALNLKIRRVGAGLGNLGNTCFMNSVLQSLLYLPYVSNYILSRVHSSTCSKQGGFCSLCELERLLLSMLDSRIVFPKAFVRNLRSIDRSMRIGRQEDAHEFLLSLISKLKKDSTPYTLAGKYVSTVTCSKCGYESKKIESFWDVEVDIRGSKCIEDSLRRFTKSEILDEQNKYFCERCNEKLSATKQMLFHKLPRVLVVLLKRFSGEGSFIKLEKKVKFGQTLNLQGFCKENERTEYELAGVVSHMGRSMRAGHYVAYARVPNGTWCCFNDASVHEIGIQRVLSVPAYILLYTRKISAKAREMVQLEKNQVPLPQISTRQEEKTERTVMENREIEVCHVGGLVWDVAEPPTQARNESEKSFVGVDFITQNLKDISKTDELSESRSIADLDQEQDLGDDRLMSRPIEVVEETIVRSTEPEHVSDGELVYDNELVDTLLSGEGTDPRERQKSYKRVNRIQDTGSSFRKRRKYSDFEYDRGKKPKTKRVKEENKAMNTRRFNEYQKRKFNHRGRGSNKGSIRFSGGRKRGSRR